MGFYVPDFLAFIVMVAGMDVFVVVVDDNFIFRNTVPVADVVVLVCLISVCVMYVQ